MLNIPRMSMSGRGDRARLGPEVCTISYHWHGMLVSVNHLWQGARPVIDKAGLFQWVAKSVYRVFRTFRHGNAPHIGLRPGHLAHSTKISLITKLHSSISQGKMCSINIVMGCLQNTPLLWITNATQRAGSGRQVIPNSDYATFKGLKSIMESFAFHLSFPVKLARFHDQTQSGVFRVEWSCSVRPPVISWSRILNWKWLRDYRFPSLYPWPN